MISLKILFRIQKYLYFAYRNVMWFPKMQKITRKMKREWDHWATSEDLSIKFDISKRRVTQIIAANIDIIEKAVIIRIVKYRNGLPELQSTPIYRRIIL